MAEGILRAYITPDICVTPHLTHPARTEALFLEAYSSHYPAQRNFFLPGQKLFLFIYCPTDTQKKKDMHTDGLKDFKEKGREE